MAGQRVGLDLGHTALDPDSRPSATSQLEGRAGLLMCWS